MRPDASRLIPKVTVLMGQVADGLEALTVRVASPDTNIQGELKDRRVRFAFRPGSYRTYREPDLEHQFARLLTLMSTGYRRGHRQIMSESGFTGIVDPGDVDDEATRRYLKGMADLRTTGATSRKTIRFRATGMREWQCRIAEGTLARLPEKQLVSEAEAAIQALINDYLKLRLFLKDECFDLGVPAIREARLAENR